MDSDFMKILQLDFSNDNYLVIREGKRKVKYFFADENVIVTPTREVYYSSNSGRVLCS